MQRPRILALALAAAGLVVFDSSAAAQAGGQPPASAADSGRRMLDPVSRLLAQREQLQLTDEQARQLEAIRSKYQEKHRARMEQLRRDREARAALHASMDSARAEIAAVLTPEQEKQVEEMRREWRSEWRDRHKGRHWRRGDHGHGDHGRRGDHGREQGGDEDRRDQDDDSTEG
jgi:Spy/CpxP family protein refolding chaperone